jgi:hypothetical protein
VRRPPARGGRGRSGAVAESQRRLQFERALGRSSARVRRAG